MGNEPINQPNQPLTPSEWRALVGRCKGKTNKQIAIEAGIRESTIKSQVSFGLGRMGYNDKRQTPDDKIWWSKVGKDVQRRLLEEPEWRPAEATEDPPPLTQPVAAPLTPSPTPTLPPANMTITGRPSRRWIAGGLVLAAVLSVLGFVLGRGQTQPQPVIPTSGPTATVRIERVAEKVTVPETVIVRETVPVEVTVIVPQTVEVTSTPQPQPTTTPEARAADAIASAPTAAPSPTIESTPLALPFKDDFEQGLRPEWQITSGQTELTNGMLIGKPGQVLAMSLDVGDFKEFTVGFDVVEVSRGVFVYLNDNWRVSFVSGGGVQVVGTLQKFSDGEWQNVIQKEQILSGTRSGRLAVKVTEGKLTVFANGAQVWPVSLPDTGPRGPIQLVVDETFGITTIDNFSLMSP